MWFMFSLVYYMLVSATSSFSYGFNVESLPTMVAREIAEVFCTNELKKYGMEKNTQFMDLCRSAPIPFLHGVEGFKKGLAHCKDNFKCHRWNCTTDEDHGFKLFGTGMARASRESAIMIAMTSAGIVEHVTNQYDSGKRDRAKVSRDDCTKINSRRPRHREEYVSVHDCNAEVVKGEIQAEEMMNTWISGLKANEKEMQMNEHNAAVGRMAVRLNMRKICKCVGLSGACNARLCFQRLKQLDVSTKWLRHRYDHAQKVQASNRAKRDGTRPLVTVERSATPAKDDLIYLLNSPNYCDYDTDTGSLGTKGRFCNRCDNGVGSCDQLCCARGHQEYQVTRPKPCNCSLVKFQMDCQQCQEKLILYKCK